MPRVDKSKGLSQPVATLPIQSGESPGEILYWLLSTSVRESGTLGFHRPPLSRHQVGLSHRKSRGMVFMYQRKQAGMGQQTIREGIQRVQERSSNDLFRHDALSWGTRSTGWTIAHVVLFQAVQR
jgi:hypothetical protein